MPDMKSSAAKAENDARWREAGALRRSNEGWIVLWLDGLKLFRAYKTASRSKTQVDAATAEELQKKITAVLSNRTRSTPQGTEGD
jgi:hypothetical protein